MKNWFNRNRLAIGFAVGVIWTELLRAVIR
jgi:hypothetical protein